MTMITNEEAKHRLQDILLPHAKKPNLELYEVLRVAIVALEKQIPKKVEGRDYVFPIYGENGSAIDAIWRYKGSCPNCGDVLCDADAEKEDLSRWGINYCSNCGQALDWSCDDDV